VCCDWACGELSVSHACLQGNSLEKRQKVGIEKSHTSPHLLCRPFQHSNLAAPLERLAQVCSYCSALLRKAATEGPPPLIVFLLISLVFRD
jgi:hypothetical protein